MAGRTGGQSWTWLCGGFSGVVNWSGKRLGTQCAPCTARLSNPSHPQTAASAERHPALLRLALPCRLFTPQDVDLLEADLAQVGYCRLAVICTLPAVCRVDVPPG